MLWEKQGSSEVTLSKLLKRWTLYPNVPKLRVTHPKVPNVGAVDPQESAKVITGEEGGFQNFKKDIADKKKLLDVLL